MYTPRVTDGIAADTPITDGVGGASDKQTPKEFNKDGLIELDQQYNAAGQFNNQANKNDNYNYCEQITELSEKLNKKRKYAKMAKDPMQA